MFDFFHSINTANLAFSTSRQFFQAISGEVMKSDEITLQEIGASEQGRPIHAFVIGSGATRVALLGGAHSDEPVGPQMLRLLVNHFITNEEKAHSLLQKYTFIILPHINPDGEAKNWSWIQHWPDFKSYAAYAFREKPGRDLEFGYPDMRSENRAVAEFFRSYAPFDLYINFHGMAFAEGVMLLIERHWIEQTNPLRDDFQQIAKSHNLPLHDHDRGGEKGFQYIGPGFTTTPEGRAMQHHFKELDDEETAAKFRLSSMEYVRSLGGDPLCLVTELPLFTVALKEESNKTPGFPQAYLGFKKLIPELRKRASNGKSLEAIVSKFEINHLPLQTAVDIQLSVIKKSLELLREGKS
jgi:hypothetical protein